MWGSTKLRGVGFACGLAAALAAGAARAADIPKPVFKAAPAPLRSDWTGFYVGLEAGGGWGRAHQSDSDPFDSGWYDLSGGIAGASWGYDWQIGQIVVGFMGDAAWSNIRGSTTGADGLNGPCGGNHCEATLEWFGTNRLRLGYAYGRWLPYIAGGTAWGYVHGKEGTGGSPTGSGAEFHYGWTVGGGLEAMIDPRWSAKVEYLYTDLRNGRSFTDHFTGGALVTESVGMQVHIVRVGINYKFAPGPSITSWLPPNPGPGAGPWNWSGLYAGVNYGGGGGQASQSDAVFDRGTYDVSGQVVGATLGYNWQRDNVVYGIEGDFDYSWIKGATSGIVDFASFSCGGASVNNCETRLRWLGTARARLGVAWDRLLPYVTGGLAVGALESAEGEAPFGVFGSGTVTRAGWTAGAGLEARIDNRWSAKFEYLYVDLGSGTGFTSNIRAEDVTFRTHLVRGGLNYRFN